MITIICAEGGSSINSLKKSIEELGEKCEILFLSADNLQIDQTFNIDSDIIHSRCGIGEYHDKLTLFSWQVLNLLEVENHIFINSLKTIYNSADKFKTIKLLSKNNIETPKTGLIRDYDDAKSFMSKNNIYYPVIVKNCFSKCGNGVKLVRNDAELKEASKNAIWYGTTIQEYVEFGDNGVYKDIRVLVVDGEVVGGYRRVSSNFITNLHQGNKVELLKINDELSELSIKCAEAIGGQIVGVDILPSKEGYKVLETNTAPGTKGFRELGINVDKKIAKCLINHKKI